MLNVTKVVTRIIVGSAIRHISNVAIIGAGQMGSGITAVSAAHGYKITLFDCDKDQLSKSHQNINRVLRKLRRHKPDDFIETTLTKIAFSNELNEAVSNADLVIETITEDLKAKHKLFHTLEDITLPECLFTTNTSSLSISDIVEQFPRKSSFCGLHFFNPLDAMKLVEVTKCRFTSDETLKSVTTFAESLGKTVVQCKDTPGFIVNRLLIPYLLEAVEMWERDEASIETIDLAMRLGAGHPMGPFELADHVGLDTIVAALEYWITRYPEERVFRLSRTLRQLLVYGRLGKKSGHGFYLYDQNGHIVRN